jgi:6,7-dimethyl-8-ribityllumazine synthase
MGKVYKAELNAQGKRFALCVARFNSLLTERLLAGAKDCLTRHGAADTNIDEYWVPGSFELPYVAAKLVDAKKKYDAVICLGAVVRGDTPHFDFLAAEVTKGIAHLSLRSGVPVIYGVITCDTLEQAIERAGTKGGNKGWDAALSAIEMVNLYGQLK